VPAQALRTLVRAGALAEGILPPPPDDHGVVGRGLRSLWNPFGAAASRRRRR
jgi:hypothetical protein